MIPFDCALNSTAKSLYKSLVMKLIGFSLVPLATKLPYTVILEITASAYGSRPSDVQNWTVVPSSIVNVIPSGTVNELSIIHNLSFVNTVFSFNVPWISVPFLVFKSTGNLYL